MNEFSRQKLSVYFGERIGAVWREVTAIVEDGLVSLEPVDTGTAADATVRLTVYVARKDRVNGTPAFIAVIDLLYRRGSAGPRPCSAWTGRARVCANGRASSDATPRCR